MMYVSMCNCFCYFKIIFIGAFFVVFKIIVLGKVFEQLSVFIGFDTVRQKLFSLVLVRSIFGRLYSALAASNASIIFSVEIKVKLQSGHFKYFGSSSLHIFLRFKITFLLTKTKFFFRITVGTS